MNNKTIISCFILLILSINHLIAQADFREKKLFSDQMVNSTAFKTLETVDFWISANSLWDAYKDSSYRDKHFTIDKWRLSYNTNKSCNYVIVELKAIDHLVPNHIHKALEKHKNCIRNMRFEVDVKLKANGKIVQLEQLVKLEK